MRSLSEMKAGDQGMISSIEGDTRFLCRVISMGLTVGCPVKVLQNQKKQPILVYGRDTMVALNRKESEKIKVGGDNR